MADTLPSDPVERLAGDPVATISPSATLRDAATALAADSIGLLVVVDPSGVQGVLSERDLVTAIVDGADLDAERVRDVATTDLVQVEESASIVEAARAMLDAQIRHLGVARNGVTMDVISIRDVTEILVSALED